MSIGAMAVEDVCTFLPMACIVAMACKFFSTERCGVTERALFS